MAIFYIEDTKYCNKCEQVKQKTLFNKNRARPDGIDVYCKECSYLIRKERLKNSSVSRTKHNEASKRFRDKNPEKVLEFSRKYRQNNANKLAEKRKTDETRLYNREYMKHRRQDGCFRLKSNISRQISLSLRKKDGSKYGQSVFQKLGYSITQLKEHLEKQFDENMNWENYGSYWHIDHIIPHSSFTYLSLDDESFKECWGLQNLRPLEAKENIKKSNKMIF
jgi:hypothetical protein